jgi:hypothetical protein
LVDDIIWNERHVLKIHVGKDRRIVFDAFEAEVWHMGTACWISKRRATAAVPRISRKRKGPAPPAFFTSSRAEAQITKTTKYTSNYPTCSLCALFSQLGLIPGVFYPSMASDTLVPDTRVLAIASHVRLIRAQTQYIRLIFDR